MAPSKSSGLGDIWKVHAVLALVQWSFAGSNILSKVAFTSGVNPIAFALYRDVVSCLCLATLAFFFERGQRPPLSWKVAGLMALLAFFGSYCGVLAQSFGLALAPASYSCLISITNPIFVFIISAAAGLEEIQWKRRNGQAKVLGVLTAIVGGILIALYKGPQILPSYLSSAHVVSPEPQFPREGSHALNLSNLNVEDWQLGAFLLILVALLQAIYWTSQVPILKHYPAPISFAASAYLIATVLLTVTTLRTSQDHSLYAIPRFWDIIFIIYAGLVPSGVGFGLKSWAAFKCGPVLLASYNPLQSFATIGMAYLFLGESIHLGSILGFLCIMSGLFLLTWGKVHSRKEGKCAEQNSVPKLGDMSNNKDSSDLEQPLLA